MIKRADREAAHRKLVEDGRRRLGEPPTEDELLAYARAELGDAEAARIEEYLFFHPKLARILAGSDPSLESVSRSGDLEGLSDEILEQDWNAIKARLAETPAPATPLRLEQKGSRWQKLTAFLHDFRWPWKLATAGAIGLAAVLGMIALQARTDLAKLTQQSEEPRINSGRRLLLPDGERDAFGEETPILLRSHAQHYLLALNVAYRPSYPEYRLRIVAVEGAGEKEVWSAAGLRRDGDTFEVWVPRSFLEAADRQRFEVHGVRDGKADLLAAYTVQLQDS